MAALRRWPSLSRWSRRRPSELLEVVDNIALNRLSQIEAGAARSEIRLQCGSWCNSWWRAGVIQVSTRVWMRTTFVFSRGSSGRGCPLVERMNSRFSGMKLLFSLVHRRTNSGWRLASLVLDEGGVFDLRVTEFALSERAGVLENSLRDAGTSFGVRVLRSART